MTGLRLVGGRLHSDGELHAGTLEIAHGHIAALGSGVSEEIEHEIDASGLLVAPGFVDLQINGGFGFDLLSDPDSVWDLGRRLPRHGVTGFLPTIISSAPEANQSMLESLGRRPAQYVGAEPLGAHFEGPMLSPERAGTHRVERLVTPSLSLIEGWSRATGVALVTIAPELPNAIEVIERLVAQNVAVAAGHSNATEDETRAGLRAGVGMVTHLFNAMAPLEHRSPNLVGVALGQRDLVAGLIVDGVHVAPTVVAAAWHAKGPEGIALVTDAVAAMGQQPGEYQFSDKFVSSDGAAVRDSDGNLAGSVLAMDAAVRNLISFTACGVVDAIKSASTTPARLIGERGRGRIAENQIADLVLLDADLEVQMTLCGGTVAYVANEARDRVPERLAEGASWRS
ncbi:MAG: N-acetylglucosamine-6-phosphate deacetylase [Acidimicrobiales bacterium]